MLKLSVKTKLDPLKVLKRAEMFFDGHFGLTLVERLVHLHGEKGITEVRISGGKLIGKAEYDSETVLNDITNYIKDRYGFRTESFALHLHAEVGHVTVTVKNEIPAEVTLESTEYDYQVKEFAEKL